MKIEAILQTYKSYRMLLHRYFFLRGTVNIGDPKERCRCILSSVYKTQIIIYMCLLLRMN